MKPITVLTIVTAAGKRLETLSKGTIYFLATFCFICIIVCLTQCVPLHKMWDFTGLVEGKCINTTALFYCQPPIFPRTHHLPATSSINILIDIWILVLPITTLLKIQRPKREKAALVGIFSLGVFSCIASIVRLHSIRIYTESKDPFYDSVPINLWSMVEIHIGVYCASIPACKALFSPAQRHRSQTGGYQYHSQGRSGKTGESGNNGSVRANESYGMKDVESGAAKPQNYLASDSEIDGESVVRPVSRV
jgi:hypothetical protein